MKTDITRFTVGLVFFLFANSCNSSDSDIGCDRGDFDGDGNYSDPNEASLAGYTSMSGNLHIECPTCTDVNDLVCLTSVGGGFNNQSR